MKKVELQKAIEMATDLIRRWDLQERGLSREGDEAVKDSQIVAVINTLSAARDASPESDRAAIQRLIDLTESRLNFSGRRSN